MENNQITYTENFELAVIDDTQDKVKFKDFRTKLMGTSDSNMTKIDAALASKQDILSPDSAPAPDSENVISSGAVYNALQNKADNMLLDGNNLRLSANGTPIGDIVTISRSVQPDWNETNTNSTAYIKNKPILSSDTLAQTTAFDIIDVSGVVNSTSYYSAVGSIDADRFAMLVEYVKAYNISTVQSVTLGGSVTSIIEAPLDWDVSGMYTTLYITGNSEIFKITRNGTVSIKNAGNYGYAVGDDISVKVTVSCPKINNVYLGEDIVRRASLDAVYAEIENIKAMISGS